MRKEFLAAGVLVLIVGCAGPYPGPDKQAAGGLQGATAGAGAGAITGFQVGAGTGPGALVGASVGAIAGGVKGYTRDQAEESLLDLAAGTRHERQVGYAHEVLSDHYKRRLELHPTRDIFPADLFFAGDDVKLRSSARGLVRELARLNKQRLAWSRLVIAAYVKATDKDSTFAKHLAEERARELSDYFIRFGIEPRRIVARAVVVEEPILIDPHDDPARYCQAIELIPLDR
ncbi:OmpA family protein [Oligoflexia bacterium]|nr:OmpA family protein [Oligoflexia bacterium]